MNVATFKRYDIPYASRQQTHRSVLQLVGFPHLKSVPTFYHKEKQQEQTTETTSSYQRCDTMASMVA